MNAKELYAQLNTLGIPTAYGAFKEHVDPPFLVYLGGGQTQRPADNTYYWKANAYRIEYYFAVKNEDVEEQIETLLLNIGRPYYKSEDIYIETENVWQITYDI